MTLTQEQKLVVYNELLSWNVNVLENEYINSTTKMKWGCVECGSVFYKTFERLKYNKHKTCETCTQKKISEGTKKRLTYTYDQVSKYIASKGCTMLSDKYINYSKILKIRCKCGNVFNRTFQTFKNSKSHKCQDCVNKRIWNTKEVAQYAKSVNCILVGEYNASSKTNFICGNCNNLFSQRLKDFINSTHQCKYCAALNGSFKRDNRLQLSDVQQYVKHTNCELMSDTFHNIKHMLRFKCSCGEEYEQSFAVFRSRRKNRCPTCSTGISPKSRLLLTKDNLLFLHHTKKYTLSQISNDIGVSKQHISDLFQQYNIDIIRWSSPSVGENQLLKWIQHLKLNTDIIQSNRSIISPYELDIYIPEYKLAIEYCGLYWHSSAKKEASYHTNKFRMCADENIKLLTIYEDEWRDKQPIVKSIIRNILHIPDNKNLPIYARNTQVVSLTNVQKQKFLFDYHIQGDGNGSVWYGLQTPNNELCAVIGFMCYGTSWLLNRFCTSYRVPGGFSKLLQHFKENHEWDTIFTFADKRWSVGHLYTTSGFELAHHVQTDYMYVKHGNRYHKFGFRHANLKNKLSNYDNKLSESINCANHGYHKIWDCGKTKYIMYNK